MPALSLPYRKTSDICLSMKRDGEFHREFQTISISLVFSQSL